MRKTIDSIVRAVLVFLMGLLVIDVVWQVFSRYVLNAPSSFTDELARFLLIWVSLLGAAYFSGQNAHIAINVLPSRLNPQNRLRLQVFIKVLIILFVFSVLVVGGGTLVYYTYVFMQITPTLQFPMAFIYAIGPVSGLLIIYYKISEIIELIKTGPEAIEGTEFEPEEFKGSI